MEGNHLTLMLAVLIFVIAVTNARTTQLYLSGVTLVVIIMILLGIYTGDVEFDRTDINDTSVFTKQITVKFN